MPPTHSKFNPMQVRLIGGLPLLPLKTIFSGTAPQTPGEADIIDEALRLFKSNVLFKNFEVHGPADKLLIYLSLYILQCLNTIAKKNKADGQSSLNFLALSQFAIPGDANFVLQGFVTAPASPAEANILRQYLTQCRRELAVRLIDIVYINNSKVPDKWWMMFARRKFVGRVLTL